MNAIRRRSSVRHGLAWLACLVLLLPVAQAAAIWHGYSHVAQDLSRKAGQPLSQASHCDLCLTAAGVTGAAPPLAQSSPLACAARFEAPQCAVGQVWVAPETLAYQSRAPPETRRSHR
jgi:hypothetical protein